MKKLLKLLLILTLAVQGSSVLAYTDGDSNLIEWEKGYRDSLDVDAYYASIATSDGNILVGGSIEPSEYLDNYAAVAKIKPDGTVLWSKSFNKINSNNAFVTSLAESTDGGYFLTIASGNFYTYDTIVIKLDKNGNQQWQKSFGGSDKDEPIDILSTSDGGCIVVGNTNSSDGNISDSKFGNITLERIYALKLDSKGNKQWSNIYGSGGGEDVTAVVTTKDGGYLLLGTSASSYQESGIKHHGRMDVWVVKIDKNGKALWNTTYGGSEVEGLFCAIPCDDGILMCAFASSIDGDITKKDVEQKNWFFKINESGKITWERYYDLEVFERPLEIIQMPSGDFILAGKMENYSDSVIMRLSKDGSVQWRYEIPYKFFCESLILTPDGGFVAVGEKSAERALDDEGYVIKFKPDPKDMPYSVKYEDYAQKLSKINVFKGSGSGFELDRAPTRIEAAVMFVRLLGGESEATEMHYQHPFKDVPSWGNDYVGYLYHYGLTKGTSSTTFGSSDIINANSYFTFILRALGYDDASGDFTWNQSLTFAKDKFLLSESDYTELASGLFYRDHLAKVSYLGLKMQLKSGGTLIQKLISTNAIDRDIAREVGLIY